MHDNRIADMAEVAGWVALCSQSDSDYRKRLERNAALRGQEHSAFTPAFKSPRICPEPPARPRPVETKRDPRIRLADEEHAWPVEGIRRRTGDRYRISPHWTLPDYDCPNDATEHWLRVALGEKRWKDESPSWRSRRRSNVLPPWLAAPAHRRTAGLRGAQLERAIDELLRSSGTTLHAIREAVQAGKHRHRGHAGCILVLLGFMLTQQPNRAALANILGVHRTSLHRLERNLIEKIVSAIAGLENRVTALELKQGQDVPQERVSQLVDALIDSVTGDGKSAATELLL